VTAAEVDVPDPKDPAPDDEPEGEAELDEALEETFPASDPIAPMRRGEDD
jgi:hypothetical protein